MARALIVGCGCRGRALGRALAGDGWAVRGTSRTEQGLAEIADADIEAAQADPSQPGTVLELVGDVALVVWLLGSASGEEEAIDGLHGRKLERLLERLVDTPVRGFLFEAVGTVGTDRLSAGLRIVEAAGLRWSIPVGSFAAEPATVETWRDAAMQAVADLFAPAEEPI